jgi:hypothetical protein
VAAQDDEDAPDLPFTPDARAEAPASARKAPTISDPARAVKPAEITSWRGRATCLTAASCPRSTC